MGWTPRTLLRNGGRLTEILLDFMSKDRRAKWESEPNFAPPYFAPPSSHLLQSGCLPKRVHRRSRLLRRREGIGGSQVVDAFAEGFGHDGAVVADPLQGVHEADE